MENYSIYLPSYSIGPKVYETIVSICKPFGHTAVCIGGKHALQAAEEKIRKAVKEEEFMITGSLWYGGEAAYENIEKLMEHEEVKKADMIFAIGGGKALDTGKALAAKLEKPVFTFPTIASTCAATTSVAIMYELNGAFKEPFFFEKPPAHAFIDTEILAHAPQRYVWAGMGDTYAKYYEASVSSRNDVLPHYLQLGVNVSQMCVAPVLTYGEKALKDNEKGRVSKELEQVVLAIIVSTGIASNLLTREHTVHYNSGLAHGVFYSLTAFPQIEKHHLHGEVVGYGVLILLLCDGQEEEFKKLYEFHKKTGLPTKLSQIEITNEELESILENIIKRSDVEHYPYKVTIEMLKEAFAKLEAME
ncbi:MAG: iron-containing alcohol dehydrogenase family protein [Lachnospiraceae bacterium]|nr:iron-containing alcohol dehydrogenase family protein [Lachnospiraceae bacterium]